MYILKCRIVRKGHEERGNIAFTFDDGPHKDNSGLIMKILESAQGKGTFFITGSNIEKNKGLAREMADRGHLLGNHTYTHKKALFQKASLLFDEIKRTKDIIEEITNVPNLFFRPPHGIITPSILSICRRLNMIIVLWNVNTKDFYREDYRKIMKRINNKIKSGAIVLFHECHFMDHFLDYSNSITALERTVTSAQEQNLEPVTVARILAE